ncbi:MAG: L,D-transpeptidase family protein [Anaerolineales bacterium]|nr:L,D-transpeptidase family protein [Anaerolineales bacterium]
MSQVVNRRSFLKLSTMALGGLAFKPPPPSYPIEPVGLGRVTVTSIGLYSEPSLRANLLAYLERDTLLTLLARINSDEGPLHNPLWYQVSGGYVHSGGLQKVRWESQAPQTDIPEGGVLSEVSVPYTRSYRKPDTTSSPVYRLYYQSTAWVLRLEEGTDGRLWYCLLDDLLKVEYFVRAEHMRIIKADELSPLSPDVPPHEKFIEVSLSHQELRAFEKGRLIFRTRISSGIPSKRPGPNGIPTATPKGRFYITKKTPIRHMGDGRLTADLEAYELPGVPWVSFFYKTGVAFHGTYWHTDFGRPKSHGCVNMRCEEAKWLYRWTTPVVPANEIIKAGHGTTVEVT